MWPGLQYLRAFHKVPSEERLSTGIPAGVGTINNVASADSCEMLSFIIGLAVTDGILETRVSLIDDRLGLKIQYA